MRRCRDLASVCGGRPPRLAVLGIAMALAAASLTAAATAAPRTTISDVEDEVMCPICGTLLELSQSPQAQRERAFVARLIARGRTKAEIKDALVAQYGSGVLAVPGGSGFDLAAYLVPAIAFALAATALAVGLRRWRRVAGPGDPEVPGPQGEAADRLEADIARYDL
jgi:cytochrome c-type biogenesis protein CcmH